ncbi:hypothetical protein RhiXN_02213 [Rhizoctonia solani]|uniref:Small ribosomal subunit protein mS38 n=1 Tax=Rhizoctonia solani TaxID=456999 RepID=A0A8H8PA79_9AGAM|nr:uncharacterized protein RhiXN_02213 [Rhizoctonia solani]QRW27618.1 hypothetical protein RhiXN_02213 [Rhizoctonia solani]
MDPTISTSVADVVKTGGSTPAASDRCPDLFGLFLIVQTTGRAGQAWAATDDERGEAHEFTDRDDSATTESCSRATVSPVPYPIPTMHPSPVLATMHLHSFFALDRPMLLLSQSTSRLFTTDPPKRQTEDSSETDSDADAARSLSHALVMSRVQGAAVWADTLARLGVPADPTEQIQDVVSMDSVKRKRRKKITKHKYKKRRKLQRSERRRLGK